MSSAAVKNIKDVVKDRRSHALVVRNSDARWKNGRCHLGCGIERCY